jgi:uncharacterized membrane protein
MLNMPATTPFQRKAVQPMLCLQFGWALIKDQYWLFVGMSLVAIIIGSVVPFGILMGPMMCGLYLALFQRRRGQPVEFGILFKGFDYLGESIIATLIHVIPVIVIIVPFYIAFYAGMFLMMARQGSEPEPAALLGFFAIFFVFLLIVLVLVIVISVLFTFTYPLIVDRRLSGLDAVKLSTKAALANFWQLLGLLMLTSALGFVGVLLCYVGVVLVFPVTFAALATAYEHVFGLGEAYSAPVPPPPPTFT